MIPEEPTKYLQHLNVPTNKLFKDELKKRNMKYKRKN